MATKKHLQSIDAKQYEEEQKQVWLGWLQKYQKFARDSNLQQRVNPRYTLRNDVANRILKDLTDTTPAHQPELLQRVLSVLENPYQLNEWFEKKYWTAKCDPIKLTCSS